jgi:hypothetical protein
VLKVQAICDHLGNIIWYSGPHRGTTHDLSLYADDHPNLEAQEQLLADKAYYGARGSNLGLVTPHKKPVRSVLTRRQLAYNTVHRWYRSRIEHAIGFLKRFAILSNQYRGRITTPTVSFIAKALKVIIHLNYMYTKKHQMRSPQI